MDSWSQVCTGSALFVFNGIDILCGTVLTVYSLYLGLNHFAPDWLYAPILVVGSVLVTTAIMSWCGAAHRRCSCFLALSSYLFILLALFEFILSLVIFTHGSEINQFLRDHQQELKLSDQELKRFEDSKFLPAYLLLALFCMETIRFCCSSGYNRARYRQQYAYKSLSTLKELDDRLINNRTEQNISEKYAALKEKYKHKYTAPDLTIPSTVPPTIASQDKTLHV